MISIDSVKFDFLADNELFAQRLNARWDYSYEKDFEEVWEEVMCHYDREDKAIIIERLPLDLGILKEEEFDDRFAERLRIALHEYCRKWLSEDTSFPDQGIRKETLPHTALELLGFFLLHGYFPSFVEQRLMDISYLLSLVLRKDAYAFREFLETYGHYDFLYRRMVFQFTDEELENIVQTVRPSESKFINLYVRIQLRTYTLMKRADIGQYDYRNVVWTLVLAYLLSESRGRFDRKQLLVHTLHGIAAHFNFSFAEMTLLLTEGIRELENKVVQLPELWSILKEIRTDVQAGLRALEGTFYTIMFREIRACLRHLAGEEEAFVILSANRLKQIFSDRKLTRELLSSLSEEEIHILVGVLIPTEKEFIVFYAHTLDRRKNAGTFSGKAGDEFRILKWEFIFAVLVRLPASVFSRKLFVLSVLQQLAAHYNLSVGSLILLLTEDESLQGTFLSVQLLSVLLELKQELVPQTVEEFSWEKLSPESIITIWATPLLCRHFLEPFSEQQIEEVVARVLPGKYEFIRAYARLLDRGHTHGLLEGKAGSDFRTLKWEFIFSCILPGKESFFHRKSFVYSVLLRLATHYNLSVSELLGYFFRELKEMPDFVANNGLSEVLEELYKEHLLPLAIPEVVRRLDRRELESWLFHLFGESAILRDAGKEIYCEKWLIYLLDEQNELFRSLWKTGRLNSSFILGLINRKASLQRLWLRRIGDMRLLTIYQELLSVYAVLRTHCTEFYFLQSIAEYLSVWMVELTAKPFTAWSEEEIIRFLMGRIRQAVPPGVMGVLDKVYLRNDKNITEIINYINQLNKNVMIMETSNFEIPNAGIVLLAPFFPRLFMMAEYLSDDRRQFKNEELQNHAIFLLQYIIYGEEKEWLERDLLLNKVLVGMNVEAPLPSKVALTEKEKELADSLLENVKSMWSKIKNISTRAFREAFLIRKGSLSMKDDRWTLSVERKAYDVLLDSIPWSYSMLRTPWMHSLLMVNWRTKE